LLSRSCSSLAANEGISGDKVMTVIDAPPAVSGQVEAAIKRRCGWQIRDLQVEARNHRVVLRGRASTYYAKQLAQHTAMTMTGPAVLENRIVVR
jgi:osmotically-inducible protein OsmY